MPSVTFSVVGVIVAILLAAVGVLAYFKWSKSDTKKSKKTQSTDKKKQELSEEKAEKKDTKSEKMTKSKKDTPVFKEDSKRQKSKKKQQEVSQSTQKSKRPESKKKTKSNKEIRQEQIKQCVEYSKKQFSRFKEMIQGLQSSFDHCWDNTTIPKKYLEAKTSEERLQIVGSAVAKYESMYEEIYSTKANFKELYLENFNKIHDRIDVKALKDIFNETLDFALEKIINYSFSEKKHKEYENKGISKPEIGYLVTHCELKLICPVKLRAVKDLIAFNKELKKKLEPIKDWSDLSLLD